MLQLDSPCHLSAKHYSLEGLLPSHSAFQGHAAHLPKWFGKLSPKGSSSTLYTGGLATFLYRAFTAHILPCVTAQTADPPLQATGTEHFGVEVADHLQVARDTLEDGVRNLVEDVVTHNDFLVYAPACPGAVADGCGMGALPSRGHWSRLPSRP
jgi:hypothetical protein